MIKYALILLCLLTSAQVRCRVEQQRKSSDYLIAPDRSTDDKFAVALYGDTASKLARKLSIQLRVYDQRTENYKQCSLNLTSRQGAAKAGVSTLRRITGGKVILAWYDELPNASDRRTRIVTMTDDCRQINPVSENLPGDPIIVTSIAGQFDVIADDEVTCRSVGRRCRVSYNLGQNAGNALAALVGRVWPWHVNLDWSTMRVKRLRYNGGKDYLALGYDGTTYDVLRVAGLTGANETLMMLLEANPQPELVTSELSICGIVYPGDDNFAQCAQYDELDDRQLVFHKTVWFDEPMTLIDLRQIGNGRMFLLLGKAKCSGEFDCWKLYGVDVRNDHAEARSRQSFAHFLCTGDRRALRIFDVTLTADRFAVRYACKNDDEFNYVIAYFDVDDYYL